MQADESGTNADRREEKGSHTATQSRFQQCKVALNKKVCVSSAVFAQPRNEAIRLSKSEDSHQELDSNKSTSSLNPLHHMHTIRH